MRRATAALLACATAIATGCGSEEDSTPAACLSGPPAFERALQSAPGEVTLPDGVAISSCLVEEQPGGELSQVGSALVRTAESLGAEARSGNADAALRLGYLVGAVQRGAEYTAGIHADLLRRLESVADTGQSPPGFEAAYGRGLEAGREHG
jgi:hypothetical protein